MFSPWSAVIPLLLTLVLLTAYVVVQGALVQCSSPFGIGAGCQTQKVGTMFERDATVHWDAGPLPDGAAACPAGVYHDPAEPDSVRGLRLAGTGHRMASRMTWAFFVGLGLLGAMAAYTVAGLLAATGHRAGGPPLGVRFALVYLPALAVFAALPWKPEFHMNVMYPVLEATVQADCELGVRHAPTIMNVVNALDTAAALAMVLGCAVLLLPGRRRGAECRRRARSASALRARLEPILHRIRILRLFLYVATATLVIGVLRMQAVMEMALSFVTPGDAAALKPIATAITSSMGLYYTLVLAAVYLPASYVLRRRVEVCLAGAEVETEVRDGWAERAGLTRSLLEAVARTITILAPLLAGPFASLLQNL